MVADIFFDPLTWLDDSTWSYAATGGRVLVTREALIEPLDKLRADSLDWYAAVRSLYYQDRATGLRKGRPAAASDLDSEFERAE
jgi:phospholipid-binding lipoprotein MlaA